MTLVILSILADLALAPHAPKPKHDVGDRFIAECPDAKQETPACKALAAEVERLAIRTLMFADAARLPIDKAFLHEAAASANCGLAGAALKILGTMPLQKEDEPVIVDALASACPGVRGEAFKQIAQLSDSRYAGWQKRFDQKESRTPILPYVPDPVPSEKRLGVPIYPGADYVYFASGKKRAFFFTTDTPEKVVGFYAKGGKRVLTSAGLQAAEPAAPDQAEIMRRMRAGEDPKKIMAELQAQAATASLGKSWLEIIRRDEGAVDPRFVEVVAMTTDAHGTTLPRVVVVFKDAILGGTGIVIPREERRGALPTSADVILENSWAEEAVRNARPH